MIGLSHAGSMDDIRIHVDAWLSTSVSVTVETLEDAC